MRQRIGHLHTLGTSPTHQIHYKDCCNINSQDVPYMHEKRHHSWALRSCSLLLTPTLGLHIYFNGASWCVDHQSNLLVTSRFLKDFALSLWFQISTSTHNWWSLCLGGKFPLSNIATGEMERLCCFGKVFSRNSFSDFLHSILGLSFDLKWCRVWGFKCYKRQVNALVSNFPQ